MFSMYKANQNILGWGRQLGAAFISFPCLQYTFWYKPSTLHHQLSCRSRLWADTDVALYQCTRCIFRRFYFCAKYRHNGLVVVPPLCILDSTPSALSLHSLISGVLQCSRHLLPQHVYKKWSTTEIYQIHNCRQKTRHDTTRRRFRWSSTHELFVPSYRTSDSH